MAGSTFGFGVHGTVYPCAGPTGLRTALKIHEREEPYIRERDVYLRLWEHQLERIRGHHVPQLLDFDDDLLAIEMTVVVRPFVLDFGGAYLDKPPDYDDETLEEWRREKEEQFEHNWPAARSILYALQRYGIYVLDVNPGNIAFAAISED